MLQNVNTAHIYFPQSQAEIPTHYISIIRDPTTNLWKLRHAKVRAISKYLAFGIHVSWMTKTPTPEIILETEPSLKPITRGKTAYDTLILSLTTDSDYILTEEAKQCTLLSRMYGQATKGRIAFWMPGNKKAIAGARISFAFDKDNYKFTDPRVRKTCPYLDRFHIRVTEEPIESLCPAPFSIITHMPGEVPIDLEYDQPLESVLQALLYTRLLPYVGHLKHNGKVDVYRLTYGPALALMWENRLLRNTDGSIPYFEAWEGKPGLWIADKELALVLRDRITTFNEPWFYQSAFMALRYFAASTIDKLNPRVFDAFNISLLPTEIEAIKNYDKKLVELPVA